MSVLEGVILAILSVVNIALIISDFIIYNSIKKANSDVADISKFYIICPGCGKRINLSQTHVYMEDNDNG